MVTQRVRDVAHGCFCFQAEDGIRDLVRSRGLGDVYKRQVMRTSGHNVFSIAKLLVPREFTFTDINPMFHDMENSTNCSWKYPVPVSYTHLTLPTSDLV